MGCGAPRRGARVGRTGARVGPGPWGRGAPRAGPGSAALVDRAGGPGGPRPQFPGGWGAETARRWRSRGASGTGGRRCAQVCAGAGAGAGAGEGEGGSDRDSGADLFGACLSFIGRNFLPLGLVAAAGLGAVCPGPGLELARIGLQRWTTAGIFVCSGLGLRWQEARSASQAPGALAFGLLSILVFTPLLALPVLRLPIEPFALPAGLAVFLSMPTTLSSGIALTQAAGGNTAFAVLLTLGSNFVGVLTVPFALALAFGSGAAAGAPGISIPPGPMFCSLLVTVLLPVAAAAALRAAVPAIARAVDARRRALGILSSCLLISVPYTQVSKAVAGGLEVSLGPLLAVVAAALAIHCLYLAFNAGAARALALGGQEGDPGVRGIRQAVVLCGSQKTLPIAVTVLQQLGPALGPAAGLAVVPCIACHIGQILVDSVLVARWSAAGAPEAPA